MSSRPPQRLRFRDGYDAWDRAASKFLDKALRSKPLLESVATGLDKALEAKDLYRRAMRRGWRALGLSTREEQERAMHALNEIQSKLLDLEEQLDRAEGRR